MNKLTEHVATLHQLYSCYEAQLPHVCPLGGVKCQVAQEADEVRLKRSTNLHQVIGLHFSAGPRIVHSDKFRALVRNDAYSAL
jgi:hypothetical protein